MLPDRRTRIHGEQLTLHLGWIKLHGTPYTYSDGYKLSNTSGTCWSTLPNLPWSVYDPGVSAVGSKNDVCGGSDYDPAVGLYTNSERDGSVAGLGSRLMAIDTNNLSAGFTQLATCPGTARLTPAMATVGGKVYMFGGCTGGDNAAGYTCTVVDNWEYDPGTNAWSAPA